MKLSEIKKNFVFTTRITLDEDTGDFIELREPSQQEVITLQGDASEVMKQMEKLLPKCVIDSSFETEDGGKATGEQIYKELSASGSLLTDILSIWLDSVPFQQRLMKKEK